MTWEVGDTEFAAVRLLPARERYEYLVKRVADRGLLWSLKGDVGWVLGADGSGRQMHPVWPHARFAAAASIGAWAETRPEAIEVHEWLDTWTPGMNQAGRLVAVFPTDRGDEAAVDPNEFASALRSELDQIE